MTKGSKHTLGLILGIAAVAIGVLLLVPLVQKGNVAGKTLN